jgi:hypothetical protein
LSRRILVVLASLSVGLLLLFAARAWLRFPSDRTPEGAYLRVVTAVNRGAPERAFAYLETRAQHACYTIRDMRRRALETISGHFPESERARTAEPYRALGNAADGADVFAIYARERGWLDRLRRDLSGIGSVEVNGDRATLVTVRGTRYAFRRRENGIWGLTLFTATLDAEAERASRDFAMIEQSAKDYDRAAQPPKNGAAPLDSSRPSGPT